MDSGWVIFGFAGALLVLTTGGCLAISESASDVTRFVFDLALSGGILLASVERLTADAWGADR